MSEFWQVFWFAIELFVLFAYLMVFFQIIGDIFRDRNLGGLSKALWVIVLIFFPILGALVYLVARGRGMATRRQAAAAAAEDEVHAYIRQIAATDPVSEIAQAQKLLEQGVITKDEFETLKAKALK
jgi:hypothetical protein